MLSDFMSAVQLSAAIRVGQVSAVEVLDNYLARIEKYNPALNAIVTLDKEQARQHAQQADVALARGKVWGPLHGVPFTLKDAHSTAGMRTTIGFPPLAEYVPTEDSTVTARLKAAGGILMGKTNVQIMLGDALQTSNPIFGRTNNPWNLERTPGGSSGGAAAAIAAALTPFDIGSDLAGSLRIPAHFCGLFGLKPTEQRVPLTGFFPDPSNAPRSVRIMSCLGPLARSVEDLALLYRIIAGPDGSDTEVKPVPVEEMPGLSLKEVKIAFAPTFPNLPVRSDIRAALAELAGQLSPLCAAVEEAALPQLDFGQDLSKFGDLLGMMLGAFQPEDKPAPPFSQYLTALDQRDQSILAWEQFFERWDVLLCPVAMVNAFAHCDPGTSLPVDGKQESYWSANAYSALFNYTGHPAVVMPYKLDREGLPIGVQLVSKRWNEAHLLGIAKAISTLTGDLQRPPGYERL